MTFFNCDKGPQQVVAIVDATEPGLLGGKTGRPVKVSYRLFDSGQFVDVVDGVCRGGLIGGGEGGNVLAHASGGSEDVHCSEAFA